MNMDVLAEVLARHTLQKQGIGPAALLPFAGKIGGGLLAAGKATLPWLGIGGAMAAGDIGARKLMEPKQPEGPSGPGGTGAGMDQPGFGGGCGPGNGSTGGMLGGPKGNNNSEQEDDQPRHSTAGFKLAEAAAYITFRKQAGGVGEAVKGLLSSPGELLGATTATLGTVAAGGNRMDAQARHEFMDRARAGGLVTDPYGTRVGPSGYLSMDMAASNPLHAAAEARGTRALEANVAARPSILGRGVGKVGLGLRRAGMTMARHPGLTTAAMAAPLALYGANRLHKHLKSTYPLGTDEEELAEMEGRGKEKASTKSSAFGDPGFVALQEGRFSAQDALNSLRAGQYGQAGSQGLQAVKSTGAGLGEAGIAGAKRIGGNIGTGAQQVGGAIGTSAQQVGGAIGKGVRHAGIGIQRAGKAMSGRPGLTAAIAAGVPLALGAGYAGYKALGGGGEPEGPQGGYDEKQSRAKGAAAIMSNNLLDVLAFNVEMADRKLIKRAQLARK